MNAGLTAYAMSEPTTAAGRELLEMEAYNSRSFPIVTAERILAIETEAAAAERAKARDLAALIGDELPRIGVRNGAGQTDITNALATHVDTILNQATLTVIGLVEGRLESLTVHQRRVFSVYDLLTGGRIECSFGHRIPLETILGAMERRVRVHGEIRYRDTGEVIGMVAETLQVLPEDSDLPSAADVYGILGEDERQTAALDVEALARALVTERVRKYVEEAWVAEGVSQPGYATPAEMAAAIAREYAAIKGASDE